MTQSEDTQNEGSEENTSGENTSGENTSGENAAKGATETILMEDGSKVEFSPKKKVVKKVAVSDQGTVKLDLFFRNGSVRNFIFTAEDPTFFKAAAHGYSQKLGDEGAGLSVEDMVQAVDELGKRLDAGDWVSKREAAVAGGSILARALVEFTKKPEESDVQARERVAAFLSKKTQAEKLALRSFDKLKPIIERLEAEKAAKQPKVDAGALLEQLG